MIKILLVLSNLILFVTAQELLVVADKNFKEDSLTLEEIQGFFLSKKRFVEGERVLVMNYSFEHPLRQCFEKHILKKSRRNLERYWQKAHYQGRRPPKIVKSKEMLLSYMQKVQPSLGYLDSNLTRDIELKILYRGTCE
ncbi:MAG: Unknown protein [uncultured Sulfurovum sp.]|uniref:Uncharacterized protein n=1 Tax=uncultured Sulfurovum sp. TaxID=269237 RepID=A0A6S6SVY3_9BACT|nr:MAG: Unknown protein [uncultured Sulfurovum sp.]